MKTYQLQGLSQLPHRHHRRRHADRRRRRFAVSLCIADDNDDFPKKLTEVREESRQESHKNDMYWCFALTPRSTKWWPSFTHPERWLRSTTSWRAQNKISSEENKLPPGRKERRPATTRLACVTRSPTRWRKGSGMFRGVSWDASALGKSLSEIFKKLFGNVVPDLYPKLEMGSRPLKGDEAEQILKAADLKALPQVFYAGEKGLGLVIKDGARYVPNPAADVAKEVLDYLIARTTTGTRKTAPASNWKKRSAASATAGIVTCFGSSWLCFSEPGASRSRRWREVHQLQRPTVPATVHQQQHFQVVAVYAGQAHRPEDVDSCGRKLRSPDRRNSGRRQERHRRGSEEVCRRGDEDRSCPSRLRPRLISCR